MLETCVHEVNLNLEWIYLFYKENLIHGVKDSWLNCEMTDYYNEIFPKSFNFVDDGKKPKLVRIVQHGTPKTYGQMKLT